MAPGKLCGGFSIGSPKSAGGPSGSGRGRTWVRVARYPTDYHHRRRQVRLKVFDIVCNNGEAAANYGTDIVASLSSINSSSSSEYGRSQKLP